MKYKVVLSSKAKKRLAKLDKKTAATITNWMMTNLNNCEDPRVYGKALVGNWAGHWRYRVGDYRIIAKIKDDEVIIIVIDIGHRRDIYDE